MLAAIDRHVFLLSEIKGANVVHASGVVLMLMGEEHRIELFNAFTKHLLSEIRPGIYYNTQVVYFNVDGRT